MSETSSSPETPTSGELEGSSIAAVDLGSNSFHMAVARVTDGAPSMLDRQREMVRFGAGLDDERNLTEESQSRALECLERFGQRVRELPRGNVRAVGTNTFRQARDSGLFLHRAAAALGHPIEVVSGIEEARLIYLGVARSLATGEGRRLVVDIGGGSTEIILGERSRPLDLESLYLGCVSMTRRFFSNGKITRRRWNKALLAARVELEPVERRFRRAEWEHAVGSSGTIRAVRGIVRAAGWSENAITPGAMKKLRDRLIEIGRIDDLELEGLSERRCPVFVGGAVIVMALLKTLRIDRLEVAEGALREGVLYDLLGRWRHEDTRTRTVASLVERYHVDDGHARRVEDEASRLHELAATAWKLREEYTLQPLLWSARLHEIGLDIAHRHFHKHGAYILASSDLAGFSVEDQELVASLVRGHRRSFPVEELSSRPETWARLAILLRLAVVLHRSRSSKALPRYELEVSSKSLEMSFPDGWLDDHPLTRADLEQEAGHLAEAGFEFTVR